jgi:menaquinone-dependent protoporphyrinogen oxidase
MSVLIIYATVEGQTGKVAKAAADHVRAAGMEPVLFDASDELAPLSFEGVTHVILAAPVHERRHPRSFETLLAASREDLAARKVLMLSISLSAAFPDAMEDAQDYLVEMKMRTGLAPDAEALVAGAIQAASYDWFETQVLRHNVLSGRSFDPEDGPHDFTDWDALAKTVRDFLAT